MNVLSLFDGISCCQVALKNLNKNVENYYASEIDAKPIDVTQSNFPDTIQIGDVSKIDEDFIKSISPVKLITGGFPCQDISLAGKRAGLKGARSGLFYEFLRVYKLCKKYNSKVMFLVENVKGMTKEDSIIINSALDSNGFILDSAIFSPQRRKRWYWTNIEQDPIPTSTSEIVLGNVLEVRDLKELRVNKNLYNVYKNLNDGQYWKHLPESEEERKKIETSRLKHKNPGGQTGFWKIYSKSEKSPTLTATGLKQKMTRFVINDNFGNIRYPSPIECERLQGLSDNYTGIKSNDQRYKMIGNAWNVKTIEFLLKNL